MSDNWSVPFRGQFVRAVLAFAGKTWTEADDASISQLMSEPVKRMPVPFMGPPMLVDKKAGFAIAENAGHCAVSPRDPRPYAGYTRLACHDHEDGQRR